MNQNPALIKQVLGFSPDEYFSEIGQELRSQQRIFVQEYENILTTQNKCSFADINQVFFFKNQKNWNFYFFFKILQSVSEVNKYLAEKHQGFIDRLETFWKDVFFNYKARKKIAYFWIFSLIFNKEYCFNGWIQETLSKKTRFKRR